MLQPTVSDGVVTWFCNRCGDPIENRGGYLGVDVHEALRIQALWERFKERNPTGSVLSEMPEETGTGWYAFDNRCAPDPEPAGEYSIEVENVRTLREVLDFTGHLMEKTWIGHTNWSKLIRQVARGG